MLCLCAKCMFAWELLLWSGVSVCAVVVTLFFQLPLSCLFQLYQFCSLHSQLYVLHHSTRILLCLFWLFCFIFSILCPKSLNCMYSYLLICSILKLHIFSLLMFRLHLSFLFLLYLLQLFLHCELHTVKHRKGELKGPPFLLLMVLLNLFAHSFSLIYFLNM